MTKRYVFSFEHFVKLYKLLNSADSFAQSDIFFLLPSKTFAAASVFIPAL